MARLRDIPIPPQYRWVWGHFIAIWQQCERDFNGNVILTYSTVLDYERCMKAPLRVCDKRVIFRMKAWAADTIWELNDKE